MGLFPSYAALRPSSHITAWDTNPKCGCGIGGVALGTQAAVRLGNRVMISEETDWIGGQLTAQGVQADEILWVEKETHGFRERGTPDEPV